MWTTVQAPARRKAVKRVTQEHVAVPETGPAVLDGGCADFYYEQKECASVRSHRRESKQTRSAKGQKKVDYQIQKRRDQSRMSKAELVAEELDDDF